MDEAAISVVIPARNAAGTLPRTLAALADQDLGEPYEVIVVDDGSTDATAAIAAAAPGVTLVAERGAGPGPARNAGVAAARGDVLAFTDADCCPAPDWLRRGLEAVAAADLVQGRVAAEPGTPVGPFDRTVTVDAERGLYETANLIVRRPLFERLGGFEDWLPASLGKPLAEDLWLGWRARRAGARTAYCDRALVHHAVFARGPAGYVAERARLVYFPAIAAKMPELRGTFFWRRWFLNERSAAFDAAVLGAALAVRSRSPLPLAAAIPYARIARRRARPFGARAPLVAAADLAADAVGLAALAIGSFRSRTPLL
ncbi:MAG TPA: glycosyltransferase family A protein [Solirubrobacterales bacterium]